MTQLFYPVAHTVDQVDDYHGTRVADPYRWLEDADSPETREWIQWQNELTFSYLKQISAHIIRLFKLDGAPDGGISLPALESVVQIDGQNPTLLYGYGGFSISVMPAFAIHTLIWLELGGVYASANLRGGSEYGEEWHQGGMLPRKQNVFDDFIVCADWLIAQKITSTPQLAIMGGSNGGLLVGATK